MGRFHFLLVNALAMDKMGVSSISRQKRLSSDLCVGSIFRRKELMTGLKMTMFLAVSNGFQ